MTDLKEIGWKFHSHISMINQYLRSEFTIIDTKKYYKHLTTRRTKGGMDVGKCKVTYSETLESPDLTEDEFLELINLVSIER